MTGGEEHFEASAALTVGQVQRRDAGDLEDVERHEVGRYAGREGGRAAGAGGGPALQRLEGQGPGLGVPDEEFAVEDQARRELLDPSRHQVREAVLDQRAAPGLHQDAAARPGGGEDERPVAVQFLLVHHPRPHRGRAGHGLGGLRQHRLDRRPEHPRASLTVCPLPGSARPARSGPAEATSTTHPRGTAGPSASVPGPAAAQRAGAPLVPSHAPRGLRMRHRPPHP